MSSFVYTIKSKNKVNVSHIAESLGGGGHIKAAGLKIIGSSLEQAKAKITDAIEKEI